MESNDEGSTIWKVRMREAWMESESMRRQGPLEENMHTELNQDTQRKLTFRVRRLCHR